MNITKAKQIVCDAGRRLVKEGLIARTWGNISLRIDEERFVITPSGRTYEDLQPVDIVEVKIDDLSYTGSIKPSSEKALHSEAYKLRATINAVIHTHQANASSVSAAMHDVPAMDAEMAEVLGPTVRCTPYVIAATHKLAYTAVKALAGRNAVLLANHGAVCVGENMDQAFHVSAVLEDACWRFIQQKFMKQAPHIDSFSPEKIHEEYLINFSKRL